MNFNVIILVSIFFPFGSNVINGRRLVECDNAPKRFIALAFRLWALGMGSARFSLNRTTFCRLICAPDNDDDGGQVFFCCLFFSSPLRRAAIRTIALYFPSSFLHTQALVCLFFTLNASTSRIILNFCLPFFPFSMSTTQPKQQFERSMFFRSLFSLFICLSSTSLLLQEWKRP